MRITDFAGSPQVIETDAAGFPLRCKPLRCKRNADTKGEVVVRSSKGKGAYT